MKIAIADNCGLKFLQDIKDHWEKLGHEVRYERGSSEYLAQWADVYYVEWIDGNLDYLWKLYNDPECENRTKDWDNNKKPKIICRMIDWDIWVDYISTKNPKYIEFCDEIISIAPHMKRKLIENGVPEEKITLIRPGVNLERFPLKVNRQTDGFQLGMVLGDFWPQAKNHMGGLDIFTQLYRRDNRWRLHLRGQHENGEYWPVMYEYYLDSRGIRDAVTLYEPMDDMNEFYNKIDILLHPGMKETFSYATAEAMAKGIPAIVNDFYGSHDIWPTHMLYQTHAEAIKMIETIQGMNVDVTLRKWIRANYPQSKMDSEYDKLL